MRTMERPTFETEASKEIYQFVERHGTAARHRVREMVSLSPETFREELSRLTEKDYIEDEGGTLRLAIEVGSVERHSTEEGTYTRRG